MRTKPDMFFRAIATVLWEKWVEFKFEWKKITASALVSPLLYMIALGWGLGSASSVTDRPYIDFLIPGIIALTTMNTSFAAVAQPLNVQRLFEHSFDHIITSPTPMPAYIIGQMLGGALRGMYCGVLILLLSIPFGATMHLSAGFFLFHSLVNNVWNVSCAQGFLKLLFTGRVNSLADKNRAVRTAKVYDFGV